MPQPVSLHSESTEYDYSGSSGPPVRAAPFALDPEQNTLIIGQSPLTFASPHDFRSLFPTELDFGASQADSPEAGAEVEPIREQKTSQPAKYSQIFKLGFFLSVLLCFSSNVAPTGLTRLITSQQMNRLVNRAIDGVKIKTRKPRSQTP